MIEHYCRTGIYRKFEKVEPPFRPVKIPYNRIKMEVREHDKWFNDANPYTIYPKGFVRKILVSPGMSPLRLSCGLFSRNGETIAEPFILERYGSWENAIVSGDSFEQVINNFAEYFRNRRAKFMEKTDAIINQGIESGAIKERRSRVPQSHGGVANLLKVLTRTMHEQGSSIRTIAKVQYTICTQAGIYVPDEFITDVLVAHDIVPGIFEIDEKKKAELEGK